MEIKDSVVIVTGASSGIGEATAKLFVAKGAKVALVSRNKEKLEQIAKELPNSFVVVCDMTKEIEISKMVKTVYEHFKRIDILVNNAGQGYDAPIEKINIATFENVFALDVLGPLIAMQEVIPLMREKGQGVIINISSGTALMAIPNMGAYSSLKRALAGLSLTAHEELSEDHISVSVVYPYVTDTNFETNTIKQGLDEEEWSGDGLPHPVDPPEYVAKKILEAVQTNAKEIFAHEWMGKR